MNQKENKSKRSYKVANLNPEKGISASLTSDEKKKEYIVCLCMTDTVRQTVFKSESAALKELKRYKMLYKSLKRNY